MNEYTVRIALSELTIIAETSKRAEEIAEEIFLSDARTRLLFDLCIESFETEYQGPSNENEETQV